MPGVGGRGLHVEVVSADNLSQPLTWGLLLDEGPVKLGLAARGPHAQALPVLMSLRFAYLAVPNVFGWLALLTPRAASRTPSWNGQRPRLRCRQRANFSMAAGVTGVKKLTRLPSGSRSRSDRLPQGIVVGSVTKSSTKAARF